MSDRTFSLDLSPDRRLVEFASILDNAVTRRRSEVKSLQRVTSLESTASALAIFSESSVSVPVPAGEDPENGDNALSRRTATNVSARRPIGPTVNIQKELAALSDMSVGELHDRCVEVFGAP